MEKWARFSSSIEGASWLVGFAPCEFLSYDLKWSSRRMKLYEDYHADLEFLHRNCAILDIR